MVPVPLSVGLSVLGLTAVADAFGDNFFGEGFFGFSCELLLSLPDELQCDENDGFCWVFDEFVVP